MWGMGASEDAPSGRLHYDLSMGPLAITPVLDSIADTRGHLVTDSPLPAPGEGNGPMFGPWHVATFEYLAQSGCCTCCEQAADGSPGSADPTRPERGGAAFGDVREPTVGNGSFLESGGGHATFRDGRKPTVEDGNAESGALNWSEPD